VAVGIPTFNRPSDCVNALATLTSDPLVDAVISAVIVSDQGTSKAKDHPDFATATAPLGSRLTIHDQPNLGGSGGYSRVMYEALKNTDCEQILFMDDDIRIEPDSILRALAFNRFAKVPTLVGGQMLNLQEPSHLHVMGEMVDQANFMWSGAVNTEYDHNFAKYPLNDEEEYRSKLLHRRIDVDFNGWWMCMIPRQVAEELGQPVPLFIKWDDVEYGLRAGEHGYPTVTLPGAAIWHMAWSDKDDAIDWQAYFHLRNRLVVASMHWDGGIRGLLGSHLKATIKHLLCLEYSTVAIQNKAMDDFLAGPEHIFSILESALPEVRKMRAQYPDAVVLPSATALPTPSDKRWRRKVQIPVSPLAISLRLTRGVIHQLKPHDPQHHHRPQINVATQDARWFSLSRVDGVTVTTADGRGVVYRQRDRAKMFELLRESLKRQALLARKFNRMRRVYREALPVLSSKQKWETVLPITPGFPAEVSR
jgi:galactofuranosylgalactofuranosylrhamnosyl-N-acetylglucosaminyl-diphospho-decaprenol beta-1,5/1,6-galactofuranosyltransferase